LAARGIEEIMSFSQLMRKASQTEIDKLFNLRKKLEQIDTLNEEEKEQIKSMSAEEIRILLSKKETPTR